MKYDDHLFPLMKQLSLYHMAHGLQGHRDLLSGVQQRREARLKVAVPRNPFPRWDNYIESEQTVRNDYSERYQSGNGEWPSTWVLGAEDGELCEEFPALRRLMDLKMKVVDGASSKGTRFNVSAEHLKSSEPMITAHPLASMLSARYDVILLAPPLDSASWDWGMTEDLPIRGLSADPSFVFLWVGPGKGGGLENGRECLAKWGFRRCEDLIFIKKNRAMGEGMDGTSSDTGLLSSQKEHCLMGIRGTVRRATDSWFVHCNVDVDTFMWDNSLDCDGPTIPPYLYTIIENFCLGTRRLEIFAQGSKPRRGWTHIGPSSAQSYETSHPLTADQVHPGSSESQPLLPFDLEIEHLRPKSPMRRSQRDDPIRPHVYNSQLRMPPTHELLPNTRFDHRRHPDASLFLQWQPPSQFAQHVYQPQFAACRDEHHPPIQYPATWSMPPACFDQRGNPSTQYSQPTSVQNTGMKFYDY